MWNPPKDVTVVAFANRLEWFSPPFNSSELPADLKKWKTEKNPKLSDAWAPLNAAVFIENYYTLCEGYFRAKLRALASASAVQSDRGKNAEVQLVERP